MIRRPPRSTRTDTLFPYTTLCQSRGRRSTSAIPAKKQGIFNDKGSTRLACTHSGDFHPANHHGVLVPIHSYHCAGDIRRVWMGRQFHRLSHSHQPLGRSCRSEEHTSELQSLMRISYAVFCLKKKKTHRTNTKHTYEFK